MKTKDIRSLYDILEKAKTNTLSAKDKLAILKIVRVIKPIAEESRTFEENARESLKDDRFDDMVQKALAYNALINKYGEGNVIPEEERVLTDQEHLDLVMYFNNFDVEMQKVMDEEDATEHAIEIPKMSEDAFNALVEANPDWDMNVMLTLSDILLEA